MDSHSGLSPRIRSGVWLLFLLGAWLAAAAVTKAVIIRHDRPDERYIALGRSYAALCDMNLPDGEGTLIAPEWILTAAHVAAAIEAGHEVLVGDRTYRVHRAFCHPQWRGSRHDIALLKLRRAVPHIRPIPVYRGHNELGVIVTILGRGYSGTGLTGPRYNDGLVRGARNRVDRVNLAWIIFRFDSPETALDLEGISAPGDSGGPALIELDGRVYVAGVSAFQSWPRPELREGRYGVLEYYTRVSAYIEWIDRILREST